MNIMLVSVTERTREIGLRLAVGARQRDILRQFLFEATGLAAIGGADRRRCSASARPTSFRNAAGWPLLIQPESIVLAVAFSGLVGVFFGWYPAMRASRLDPIEACGIHDPSLTQGGNDGKKPQNENQENLSQKIQRRSARRRMR